MELTTKDYELFKEFMLFKQMKESNNDIVIDNNISNDPVTINTLTRRKKGSGCINKLSGKRERPFVAKITVGYDKWTGKQNTEIIGYFKTREDANKGLDIYNLEEQKIAKTGAYQEYTQSVDAKLPKTNKGSSVNTKTNKGVPTLDDIWQIVLERSYKKVSDSTIASYKTSYKYLLPFKDTYITMIKIKDLQDMFDKFSENEMSYSSMFTIKVILKKIFDFAIMNDLIDKNYAEYIQVNDIRESKKNKKAITHEHIKVLFKNADNGDIESKMALIMIYTGMRPSELLELKTENVHIEESYVIGGIKTQTGKNRIIPIHDCIKDYLKDYIDSEVIGKSYNAYAYKYFRNIRVLDYDYTPHCCRHTFASLSEEYELKIDCVKRIMGHKFQDLTKDIYTHANIERLVKEVNRLPYLG